MTICRDSRRTPQDCRTPRDRRTPHGGPARHAVLGAALAVGLASASAGVSEVAAQTGRGFLLGTPVASLTIRAGYNLPRAGGGDGEQSLWDFTREELTVETRDLASLQLAGDLGVRVRERLDVVLGVGFSRARTQSEFRDWVGADDLPIAQNTEFKTIPVTVGVRAYLRQRGRSVGQFAWIPQKWNAYAGVAGGLVWYRFSQFGEFVDYETRDIFEDSFDSDGRVPTVHFMGGTEVTLGPRIALVGEARYGFAKAPLEADFVGFPDLDLAGFQATAGVSVRF